MTFAIVKREPPGKVPKVFPENETSAVQPGLQRLRLHPKHGTRLFGREPLDIPQDHRHSVHLREVGQRFDQPAAHLAAQYAIVGE